MKNRSEFEDIVDAIRRGGIDALVFPAIKGIRSSSYKARTIPIASSWKILPKAPRHPDGTVLYVNDRFAEIVAVSRERLIGAPLLEHLT